MVGSLPFTTPLQNSPFETQQYIYSRLQTFSADGVSKKFGYWRLLFADLLETKCVERLK
jgi:hypothetical protein